MERGVVCPVCYLAGSQVGLFVLNQFGQDLNQSFPGYELKVEKEAGIGGKSRLLKF